MDTFTLGQQVVLKTNPYMPILTVLKVNPNGTYYCRYENPKHEEEYHNYEETLLQKYSNPATIILF